MLHIQPKNHSTSFKHNLMVYWHGNVYVHTYIVACILASSNARCNGTAATDVSLAAAPEELDLVRKQKDKLAIEQRHGTQFIQGRYSKVFHGIPRYSILK